MFNGKISVKEASEMLGLTQKYLRTLATSRKLTYYKLGRRIFFDMADIEKEFSKNRFPSIKEIIEEKNNAVMRDA